MVVAEDNLAVVIRITVVDGSVMDAKTIKITTTTTVMVAVAVDIATVMVVVVVVDLDAVKAIIITTIAMEGIAGRIHSILSNNSNKITKVIFNSNS